MTLIQFFLLFHVFIVTQVVSADEVVKMMIDHMTNVDSQSCLPLSTGVFPF